MRTGVGWSGRPVAAPVAPAAPVAAPAAPEPVAPPSEESEEDEPQWERVELEVLPVLGVQPPKEPLKGPVYALPENLSRLENGKIVLETMEDAIRVLEAWSGIDVEVRVSKAYDYRLRSGESPSSPGPRPPTGKIREFVRKYHGELRHNRDGSYDAIIQRIDTASPFEEIARIAREAPEPCFVGLRVTRLYFSLDEMRDAVRESDPIEEFNTEPDSMLVKVVASRYTRPANVERQIHDAQTDMRGRLDETRCGIAIFWGPMA